MRATLWGTKQRRENQACKTYQLKVDLSHLSEAALDQLKLLFLEAKWFYNDMLARGNPINADYKRTEVLVKNASGELEARLLTCLSAQMRQEIVDRSRDNMRSLASLKARGYSVGLLKFKSRINSIPLKQYGKTHQLIANYVKIQNIAQPLKVMGVDQIPKNAELASAVLKAEGRSYCVHLSTFQPRAERRCVLQAVGIDFGITEQMTLSNGVGVEESVRDTPRLRRIHKELSRRTRYGRNWRKTVFKLLREYEKLGNRKRDVKNKIVSRIVSTYETVVVQDDSVSGWQKVGGRRVRETTVGGIMGALKERAGTSIVVPRGLPTTMQCSRCGAKQRLALKQRTYRCPHCGQGRDRNLNSAINILNEGVPAERRELTPVDVKAAAGMMEYFNSIPGVSASLVVEAGSPRNRIP